MANPSAESSSSSNTTSKEITGSIPLESAEYTDYEDRAAYSIVVRTSSDEGSSTDGSVFIQLSDKDGFKTSKCRLNCSISHRKKFQRGHVSSNLFVPR